jgi:hypothetical protein
VRLSNGPVLEWSVLQYLTKPDISASLDPFGMNKIFCITLFFIKRSRLVYHSKTRQKSPVFEWSKQDGCQNMMAQYFG